MAIYKPLRYPISDFSRHFDCGSASVSEGFARNELIRMLEISHQKHTIHFLPPLTYDYFESKRVVVARIDTDVIGFLTFDHQGPLYCNLMIAVDEKFRGQGIGKAMTVFLIDLAFEENISTILCDVDHYNSVSMNLLESLGFEKRPGIYGGQWNFSLDL